ncbi:ABC transporter permease [Streptococcus chenjunshii]|uniref:ABC transporter permease n=1 Tax=Streptococcus chenjunshii TaxID=2173853 RepID=A0A372KMB4_9STRE|nr:ABC transporter permease [Streptococcus chenjunshii]AXQ78186.1 ABC transporter permease [Streptococcus chenjunshii]RFU50943.1 ABC transporter permease [Streptococcus chenjunshii]RFU53440.1 ABC transporter permease [Streptococcus chenjunshii]
MNTFKAILYQEYLINKRSLSNLFAGIGMPVAFFLLFSTIWGSDDSMSKEMAALSTQRYMLQMAAFSSLSFAFYSLPFAFQEDKAGHRFKNIQHSPVPMWQYYLSKILAVLVHFVLAIVVVFAVGHFAKGVSMSVTDWLASAGLLFMGAVCFMPFGALFVQISSAQTLAFVANIFYLGLAVLGGLWMPISTFPDLMQKLAKVTPTYHLNNLLISYFDGRFSFQSQLILLVYAAAVFLLALAIGKLREVN